MRKKELKMKKGDMIAFMALFFGVMAAIVFTIVTSLFYRLYRFSGLLAVPAQAVIMGNVLAVLAIALAIYALVNKGSKKLALIGLLLGFIVVSLPYLLGFF